MALKALMLKKKIDETRKALNIALEKRTELQKREAELEESVNEINDETTDEEKAAVDEAVEKYEADKTANEEETANLEKEVRELEAQLEEEEKKQRTAIQDPAQDTVTREETKVTMKRTKFFGMTHEERTAFLNNDEVKNFLERVKALQMEKRAITGADITIPTVVLSLIRENITEYSKLISKVNLQKVPGKARQGVMGIIPEAVWTEMCAKLNEIDLGFTGVEVDGYKVGGFIPVCNALLADSDEDLAAVIIEALGKAIGYALDKAIIYGTGTKMPVGIFTRLAQTADPSDSRSTIPWVDLHTSNILTITAANSEGTKLFKNLINSSSAAKSDYAKNGKFWAMNETTYNKILAESVGVNAGGAVVAGMDKVMPIIGGECVILNFIQDNVVIGGYGELYLLAERDGGTFAQSEHVRFTDDQTVFKGTARYDGLPVIANGFVAIGINATTPSASGITFAPDTANATPTPTPSPDDQEGDA